MRNILKKISLATYREILRNYSTKYSKNIMPPKNLHTIYKCLHFSAIAFIAGQHTKLQELSKEVYVLQKRNTRHENDIAVLNRDLSRLERK